MTNTDRRMLLLGVGAASLASCGSVYTPDYILRTLTRQDANTDDFLWKNRITIPASTAPQPISVRAAPGGDTAAAFHNALGDESVEAFMARTNTQSLLLARGDGIHLQHFASGLGPETPQAVFSVSKSFLSLVVGQAIAAGHFAGLDDLITRYLPELRARDARFDNITLGHLLDMRSGIAFSDNLSFPFVTNDKPLVYYASDLRAVVLTRTRIAAAPGEFLYNDYNPNLVALARSNARRASNASPKYATRSGTR